MCKYRKQKNIMNFYFTHLNYQKVQAKTIKKIINDLLDPRSGRFLLRSGSGRI